MSSNNFSLLPSALFASIHSFRSRTFIQKLPSACLKKLKLPAKAFPAQNLSISKSLQIFPRNKISASLFQISNSTSSHPEANSFPI